MKIKNLPAIFEPARPVLQRIERAGFEAYFVGGCVRDTILGDHIHDIDIATSAYPSEIKSIFKRTVDTGIEHGTVMILDHGTGYETTTFRTESGYQDFRRPDKVTFVRSLKEDLKRRDFTINALAMKEDGTVIDLFDGLTDLKRHLIRAVGNPEERFHEDALRMMRAVRFAAKLDFKIDEQTLNGINDNGELLTKIAVERIETEFTKLLLGQNPQRGLHDFISTSLYQYCPQLAAHGHDLEAFSNIQNWSMIKTKLDAWLAFTNALQIHGANAIRQFMKAWKLSNDLIAGVQRSDRILTVIGDGHVSKEDLFKAGQSSLTAAVRVAQLNGQSATNLLSEYNQLPIHDSHELAVNGGQLIQKAGIKPGPRLGKVIHQLQVMVLNNQVQNDSAALISAAKKL